MIVFVLCFFYFCVLKFLGMKRCSSLLLLSFVAGILLLESCAPKANLSYFKTNTIYKSNYQDSIYLFSFSDITPKKAKGVYYCAGNNLTVEPITFKHSLRRISKKAPFIIENTEIYNYPIKPSLYPERYKKELYQVEVIRNVTFARVKGFWDSYITDNESYFNIFARGVSSAISPRDLELKMDIYMPVNAGNTNRPFLMIIHGGAFYIGDKESQPIVAFCRYFASLGYTTASINYRLGFLPSKTSVERAGYQALQDAHAAMRFMIENRYKYQIDTSLIFVCGTSAGAITTLNLAFMQNSTRPESVKKGLLYTDLGNIENSGNLLTNKFSIKAIGNMWGAINDLNHLKSANIPVVSFHGDKDRIVPYKYDYPFEVVSKEVGKIVFGKMYGSFEIHKMLQKLNRREKLFTFENFDHEPHVDSKGMPNSKHAFIKTNMAEFFYYEIAPDSVDILRNSNNLQFFSINVPAFNDILWGIEGGFIIETTNNEARVVWIPDSQSKTLSVSGRYQNGAPFFKTIHINK